MARPIFGKTFESFFDVFAENRRKSSILVIVRAFWIAREVETCASSKFQPPTTVGAFQNVEKTGHQSPLEDQATSPVVASRHMASTSHSAAAPQPLYGFSLMLAHNNVGSASRTDGPGGAPAPPRTPPETKIFLWVSMIFKAPPWFQGGALNLIETTRKIMFPVGSAGGRPPPMGFPILRRAHMCFFVVLCF